MEWYDGYQVWLSEAQSLNNAQLVINHFNGSDWSRESLSAMLGNMRHESSINPNMYEYGYNWNDDRGYGLVQWTPRSKYWDWAVSSGLPPEKAESQLARIDYEVDNNIQWIARPTVDNLTFVEFRTNSRGLSLPTLVEFFMWGYERPNQQAGLDSLPSRVAFAQRAYNELDWAEVPSTPQPSKPPKKHNLLMKLYLTGVFKW